MIYSTPLGFNLVYDRNNNVSLGITRCTACRYAFSFVSAALRLYLTVSVGNPEFVYFSGYVHKISAIGRKQKRVLLVTSLGMYVDKATRHLCSVLCAVK